jgi:hypothetical protein
MQSWHSHPFCHFIINVIFYHWSFVHWDFIIMWPHVINAYILSYGIASDAILSFIFKLGYLLERNIQGIYISQSLTKIWKMHFGMYLWVFCFVHIYNLTRKCLCSPSPPIFFPCSINGKASWTVHIYPKKRV